MIPSGVLLSTTVSSSPAVCSWDKCSETVLTALHTVPPGEDSVGISFDLEELGPSQWYRLMCKRKSCFVQKATFSWAKSLKASEGYTNSHDQSCCVSQNIWLRSNNFDVKPVNFRQNDVTLFDLFFAGATSRALSLSLAFTAANTNNLPLELRTCEKNWTQLVGKSTSARIFHGWTRSNRFEKYIPPTKSTAFLAFTSFFFTRSLRYAAPSSLSNRYVNIIY